MKRAVWYFAAVFPPRVRHGLRWGLRTSDSRFVLPRLRLDRASDPPRQPVRTVSHNAQVREDFPRTATCGFASGSAAFAELSQLVNYENRLARRSAGAVAYRREAAKAMRRTAVTAIPMSPAQPPASAQPATTAKAPSMSAANAFADRPRSLSAAVGFFFIEVTVDTLDNPAGGPAAGDRPDVSRAGGRRGSRGYGRRPSRRR